MSLKMPSDDSAYSQGIARHVTRDFELARRDLELPSAHTGRKDSSTSSEDSATSLYTKWRSGRSNPRWRMVASHTSKAGILATLALILNMSVSSTPPRGIKSTAFLLTITQCLGGPSCILYSPSQIQDTEERYRKDSAILGKARVCDTGPAELANRFQS